MAKYKICSRCVMDTSDPEIHFNDKGICNHCTELVEVYLSSFSDKRKNQIELDSIIKQVRNSPKKSKYDCIIGLSGGVDSSYLAFKLVKEYNLNPLAVHVDNGWNSEQAASNINNIVNILNIDLITHVIDWDEFKELQKAFLKASVVDLELLSDHAISVVVNRIAKQRKIKYFLIGANYQTESILPSSWFYSDKLDSANIKDIFQKFGSNKKLKTYPFLSFLEYAFFGVNYGKWLIPLSYMDYDKNEAKKILINELDWKDYGGKHHESFITKFYQTYILPIKFGIDKRRAHFSNLIAIGQMKRDDALNQLDQKPYLEAEIEESITYFCKKLDLTNLDFNKIMTEKRREHSEFETYKFRKEKLWKLIHRIRPSRK